MDHPQHRTLIVFSLHHHSTTARIAEAIAGILGAQLGVAHDLKPDLLDQYDLVGFGSGIDSGSHDRPLLAAAERLPEGRSKKPFIFSTSAICTEDKMKNDHSALKKLLQSKGYLVLGEFGCKGFTTNSFLKYFGGMNRGRPNGDDLR